MDDGRQQSIQQSARVSMRTLANEGVGGNLKLRHWHGMRCFRRRGHSPFSISFIAPDRFARISRSAHLPTIAGIQDHSGYLELMACELVDIADAVDCAIHEEILGVREIDETGKWDKNGR